LRRNDGLVVRKGKGAILVRRRQCTTTTFVVSAFIPLGAEKRA